MYGADTDYSRLDWMVVKELLRKGYGEGEVRSAMVQASPAIAQRKCGHVEDYVERTVRKAAGSTSQQNP
jgi:hypothetical protein